MAVVTAFALGLAPLPEPALPHGVSLVASARAEIIRAERVTLQPEPGAVRRTASPERDGVIIHFD